MNWTTWRPLTPDGRTAAAPPVPRAAVQLCQHAAARARRVLHGQDGDRGSRRHVPPRRIRARRGHAAAPDGARARAVAHGRAHAYGRARRRQ
eukprot:6385999-Prymnesium_polylepis.2